MKRYFLIGLFSVLGYNMQAQVGIGTNSPQATFHVVDLAGGNFVVADSGRVGIGTVAIDSSARMEIKTSTEGMLLPRMTTTQRDAINGGSPAEGLVIYNTDLECINYWDGTKWTSPCVPKNP